MIAWVIPALYPAKPWTFGPPSTSGQLEKCGIGLSLRFRGEKPIEPWRGRCSFGITPFLQGRTPLHDCAEMRGRVRATVTRPAGPEGQGRIPGVREGLPERVWSARPASLWEGRI